MTRPRFLVLHEVARAKKTKGMVTFMSRIKKAFAVDRWWITKKLAEIILWHKPNFPSNRHRTYSYIYYK
jgi:hypothetical protein